MSATLTSRQIEVLKDDFMQGDKCRVLTEGVDRDNLSINLKRYWRQKLSTVEDKDEAMDDIEVDHNSPCSNKVSTYGFVLEWSSCWHEKRIIIIQLSLHL